MEMDTETLLRIVALVIAGSLLVSGFNLSKPLDYIKNLFKRRTPVTPDVDNDVSFLQIVDSWHTLRSQCEQYGLRDAVEKIDEVFPLLNTED